MEGWIENMPYTAVSRVQSHLQIQRVVKREGHGVQQQSVAADMRSPDVDVRIKQKLAQYKRSGKDAEHMFALTIQDVYGLADMSQGVCAVCKRCVLWQYEARDDLQFSIDRLDDSLGHTVDNCRLTCLACNRNHRR